MNLHISENKLIDLHILWIADVSSAMNDVGAHRRALGRGRTPTTAEVFFIDREGHKCLYLLTASSSGAVASDRV